MFLVQGRRKISVQPAVTAVLLHQISIVGGTGCNVYSTGFRGITVLPEETRVLIYHMIMDAGSG